MPKPAPGRDFYIATADEIRAGRTTDLYFVRTLDILKKAGRSRANVVAEVTTGSLPNDWPWGIFCGLEEVVHLLAGKDVSLWALSEGSVFPPKTHRGIPLPVMTVEGPYEEWALYETPVLGMICQASGIATKAARIRKLANGKQVLSFGVRRMHPGIAPRELRCDRRRSPLGAGPPWPQGREDFRVGLRGRKVNSRSPRSWRRWLRRGHEFEQRSDDRFRLGPCRGRRQACGETRQVRRPQRPSALPERRHLRGRRADVSGVRCQDGTGVHPVP